MPEDIPNKLITWAQENNLGSDIVRRLIRKNQFKKHRIIFSLVVNGQCVPKAMLALYGLCCLHLYGI